ncbi:Acyl-CoA dehydrogenase/oxidase C-terminal [Trinorchestia longiramus]|nr:Acyl-CoA dehydrogenase/oxidase C-terminal [Trinorchestia longiramus]
MIPELRNLSYERRLQRLELISLEQRRLRGQLIETFKNLNGLNNVILEGLFERPDLYVEGENVMQLASMAKLKSGRLAREITDSCLQYWGGMGFTNEVLVSRLYRDMRLVSIGGGADEVMLGIIAKTMGNLPSRGK